MKEKKPWYVRLKNLEIRNKQASISVFVISSFLVVALSAAIWYYISISEPMKPYEVAYDIEFNIFAEGILEDIAHKVINENNGIDIQKIPAIVSEYNIKYADKRIEFNYLLDYSQVISEYYSKTGKETIL